MDDSESCSCEFIVNLFNNNNGLVVRPKNKEAMESYLKLISNYNNSCENVNFRSKLISVVTTHLPDVILELIKDDIPDDPLNHEKLSQIGFIIMYVSLLFMFSDLPYIEEKGFKVIYFTEQ